MKVVIRFALGLFTAGLLAAETPVTPARPERPVPAVEHVVIIIADGLRPDCALLADAPTIRAMVKEGAYSLWARTTDVAITLPSCTSVLTGVSPAKHGVDWNRDQLGPQGYPKFPTVLQLATEAGYVTALVGGKSKLTALARPGTVTHVWLPTPTAKCHDDQVATEAERVIGAYRPALMCIHFPDGDAVAHAKGWGSPEHLAQIAATDRQLARVLAALDGAGIRGSTLVLLTADHGGAGRTHGGLDPRSRHIPWIASGAGVRHGFDLTQVAGLDVRTEDTGATACWLLGLPLSPDLDGRPVRAAFEAR